MTIADGIVVAVLGLWCAVILAAAWLRRTLDGGIK